MTLCFHFKNTLKGAWNSSVLDQNQKTPVFFCQNSFMGRQARVAPLMENALKFYSILFWTSFFMSTVRKGHTTWCPGSQRRRCSHVAPPERGGGLRHRQRWQDRATLGLEVQLLDYYAFDWKISTTTLARNYSRIPGCTQMLWGHTSDVSSVAFHPSGLSFATCSEDKTVSQGFLAIQKRHWWLTGNVTGIKANQSISNPSKVRLWDIRGDQELCQYKPPSPNSR